MIILIFIHSLSSGGAERVAANLANYWAEKGWDVTVATLASTTDDFYQLHPAVKRIALNIANKSSSPLSAIGNNIRRIQALRHLLKDLRPDAALAMMSTANILLAISSFGIKNITTIGSEHTHPPRNFQGGVWGFLRTHLYGWLDAVTALTVESAEWLRKNTKAQNTPVIPNAVPWPLKNNSPYLEPPKKHDDLHILLAVGRLNKVKGFHHLITIFEHLSIDFKNWQLVIIGEGPERASLESQIAAAHLERRIILPGLAGNIGEWYAAADLYVMSSQFEGFGNTLAEAMAYGVPAVSFDCETGPRAIIRHNIDGILIPANDIGSLEKSLRHLMSDPSLRKRFSEKAIDAQDRFSIERISNMWEIILSQKLKTKNLEQ